MLLLLLLLFGKATPPANLFALMDENEDHLVSKAEFDQFFEDVRF